MNIYIGNLSFDTTEATLRASFAQYGDVDTVNIIMDRESGRPRGFGFAEMPNGTEGQAAVAGLNGSQLDGRALNVNEAKPKAPRDDRGSFGGGDRNRSW